MVGNLARAGVIEARKRAFAAAVMFAMSIAGVSGPVHAAMVRASDPTTIVDALRASGYEATLTRDDAGDPLVNLDLDGWKAILLFYECNAARHDECQSVQFRSTFDAEGEGMIPAEALQFAAEQRFVSVALNRSNDPVLSWDVVTGSGIPAEVFVLGTQRFLEALKAMAVQLYR